MEKEGWKGTGKGEEEYRVGLELCKWMGKGDGQP